MSVDEPRWWWEKRQRGEIVPLAFVRIDRVGSTSKGLSEDAVTRLRARYTGSIEDLARNTGAAQPLRFRGDGVMLFYTDADDKLAPVRAFEAARALWERMTVDLDLPVRIAVHAARVAWHPDIGRLAHPAIDSCVHLEQVVPPGSVAMSERVFLALPEKIRDQAGPLGVTLRDGVAAWIYPATAAELRDPAAFVENDDLALWTAFRAYALSSDVTCVRYAGLRSPGLRLRRSEPPNLDVRDVFVPVELSAWRYPRRVVTAREVAEESPPWDDGPENERMPSMSLAELFGEHRSAVVLGGPGAGKSTLLRWLAVAAAQGPETLQRELGVDERLVPLVVSLGRLAELRHGADEGSAVAPLARYFHHCNVGEASTIEAFLAARLEAGNCLVLLDGLDELRSEERASLRGWLESFCSRFVKNRFVVTSRIMGYPGIGVPGAVEVVIRPWREEQIAHFVRAFHSAYRAWETGRDDSHVAEQEARRMLDVLRQSPKILALAGNPFLATSLALIHRAEGHLPRHRVAVYQVFARGLCETWSHARRVAEPTDPEALYEEEALSLLGRLALRMHEVYPSGTAPEAFVIETLVTALTETSGALPEAAHRAAREFLDRAAQQPQILYERAAGQWAFRHLSFQEFFTAAGLHAAERFEDVAMDHLFEPRWLETIRIGVGYYVQVQKRPRAAVQFIERVGSARLEGDLAWVTSVLRKQIPMVALLVAEASDAVPRRFQDEVAREFSSWRYFFPLDTWEPIADEVWATDFGKTLAHHVNDQHLCATYNDLIWNELGYYGSDSIEEYLNPTQLGEFSISDRVGDAELLPVLSEILLERKVPNGYAIEMLAEIGGSGAIEILLEVVRREVNFDVESMDSSALGAVALAALWRISEGL